MVNTDARGGSRGRVQGVRTPPGYNWCSAKKKKTMWFIGVEVEQETSEPFLQKILDPPLGAITILASSLVLSELYSDAWETTLSTVVQYEINWLVSGYLLLLRS